MVRDRKILKSKGMRLCIFVFFALLAFTEVFAATGSSSSFNVTAIENALGGGAGSSASFNVSTIVASAAQGSSASFNVSLGYVFSGEEKPQEQPAPQTPAPAATVGGGSGAGISGIGSPATFIQSVPELQANVPVAIPVGDPNIAVSEVTLTLAETVTNAKITIAAQDSASVSNPVTTGYAAAGQPAVYKYFDISLTDYGHEVKSATIDFFVEKSWISSQNIVGDTIKLAHFKNGNWTELRTEKISEDAKKIYFTATTGSFSLFAIIGKTLAALNAPTTHGNCGDNLCQASESHSTCPYDCVKGNWVLETQIYRFSLIAGSVSVVVLIMFIYLHERKPASQKPLRNTDANKSSSMRKKKVRSKVFKLGWRDRLAKHIIVIVGRSSKK